MALKIIQGSTRTLTLRIRDEEDDPIDLTTYDKFLVCLTQSDGTTLQITESANANGSVVNTVGDPILGKLSVLIKAADSELLRVGARQTVYVEWDITASPDPQRAKVENALEVEDFNC